MQIERIKTSDKIQEFIVSGAAIASQGTVTFADVPADADTITIDSRVYEFDTNGATTGDVDVDVSGLTTEEEAAEAFANAINNDGSAVVTAEIDGADVILTAITAGVAGNSITFVKDGTNITVDGGGTLGGTTSGANATNSDNYIKIINNSNEEVYFTFSINSDNSEADATMPTKKDGIYLAPESKNLFFDFQLNSGVLAGASLKFWSDDLGDITVYTDKRA